jgi:hypothetical protein
VHIADDPFLIRHPCSAQRYRRGGVVRASYAKAFSNHVKRNRQTAPAAKIKNSRAPHRRNLMKRWIEGQCMTLVVGCDPVAASLWEFFTPMLVY